MRSSVLVIPCHNEAARLPVTEVRRLLEDERVGLVLVDDGSTDATHALLTQIAAEHGDRVRVIKLVPNRGKAEATRAGLNEAVGAGASVVGFADADFATPAEELLRLLDALEERSTDVVLASRVARLGAHIDRSPVRHLLGRCFATVAAFTLGVAVYDTQCGAKWFRATPALRAAIAAPFSTRWAFDVELLARLLGRIDSRSDRATAAHLAPGDIVEVPLDRWSDVPGSKLTFGAMGATMRDVLTLLVKTRLSERQGRTSPRERGS
jgi:glycosyltransferase involved in cell wall biosynthesis